jgi:hypothetical protein
MSTYATTTVDRRAAYYTRLTADKNFDALSLYIRIEKGRRWQLARFKKPTVALPANVLRLKKRAV